MPLSFTHGDHGDTILPKINSLFGVESGALANPWALTFDIYHRYRTLSVTADIALTLAASGKVSQTFETLVVTGDGSHVLTFPAAWIMLGDTFNFNKIQEIYFRYTGVYVIGVITILDDVHFAPTLTSATIEKATDTTLDLVFNEAVDITVDGWTVSASGGAVTVSAVASGSGTTAPKLTLSRSIASTETVTVSYNTGTGATESLFDLELGTVSAAAVTNNVYVINLEVLFTGTSVETAKGTITNPDAAALTISQNGKLLFTRTTDAAVASGITNFWRTVDSFTRGTFAFTLNLDSGFTFSALNVFLRVDANNEIAIFKPSNSTVVTIRIRVAASATYTLITAISVNNRFRIDYNAANEVKFYYYNAGWEQMGVTQTANIGASAQLQFSSDSNTSDAAAHVASVDTVYITDKPYAAQTP